jgi:hypothetical protein
MILNLSPSAHVLELAPNVTAIICTGECLEQVGLPTVALDVESGEVVPLTDAAFRPDAGELDDVATLLGCAPESRVLKAVSELAIDQARAQFPQSPAADAKQATTRLAREPDADPFEALLASCDAALARPNPWQRT